VKLIEREVIVDVIVVSNQKAKKETLVKYSAKKNLKKIDIINDFIISLCKMGKICGHIAYCYFFTNVKRSGESYGLAQS